MTATVVLKVAPNQLLGSCSIRQANVYVPTLIGAVAATVKVAFCPGLIAAEGKEARLVPQIVLSCGLCEPKRYGFAPLLVHVVPPLFFIVMVALNVWPAITMLGTLLLTTAALLPTLTVAVNVAPNHCTFSCSIFQANVY